MEYLRHRTYDADRLKTALLVAIVLLSSLHASRAHAVPGVLKNGDLDRLVPQLMEAADIPGMSVVMLRNKRVSYVGNFGTADRSTGQPVDADTTFFAASLSKPLFAYAVLRLAQRGVIELDRPLCEYLPNPRLEHDRRYRAITARMVLSHTSGLPNWAEGGPIELSFEPGSDWEYSGEGYVYLQKVVEKLTGTDLNGFMDREVFTPLGMEDSAFYSVDELHSRMATGHNLLGHPTKKPRPTRNSMNPAGTLITTAADYARFIEAFLAHDGMDAKLASNMSTAQARPSGFFGGENRLPVYWGLGFGIESGSAGNTLWQWGDNLDYRNFVMVNPQQGSGIVILSNSENGMSVARRICSEALEGPHPAFDWLPFAEFDDPRFIARIRLERSYVENDGRDAAQLYDSINAELNDTQMTELVISLGRHLVRGGLPQHAISLLELHVRNNSSDPEAHDLLASFYLSSGRSELALKSLRQSAKLDPGNEERKRTIARIERQL